MRFIILAFMLLSLSGCSTLGRFARGFGQGMAQSSKSSTIPQAQYCYATGNDYNTQINCY